MSPPKKIWAIPFQWSICVFCSLDRYRQQSVDQHEQSGRAHQNAINDHLCISYSIQHDMPLGTTPRSRRLDKISLHCNVVSVTVRIYNVSTMTSTMVLCAYITCWHAIGTHQPRAICMCYCFLFRQ